VDIWDCDARIRRAKTPHSSETLEDGRPAFLDDDTLPLLSHDVLPLWPDDWVLVERERHRQARLHSLERLSQKLCRTGWYEETIEAALAAVAGEPLRESAYRRVIEARLAEGNPGEALRQYDIHHRLLREELGPKPLRLTPATAATAATATGGLLPAGPSRRGRRSRCAVAVCQSGTLS
jgi:DNA-binding SARP family transcriptional activator